MYAPNTFKFWIVILCDDPEFVFVEDNICCVEWLSCQQWTILSSYRRFKSLHLYLYNSLVFLIFTQVYSFFTKTADTI